MGLYCSAGFCRRRKGLSWIITAEKILLGLRRACRYRASPSCAWSASFSSEKSGKTLLRRSDLMVSWKAVVAIVEELKEKTLAEFFGGTPMASLYHRIVSWSVFLLIGNLFWIKVRLEVCFELKCFGIVMWYFFQHHIAWFWILTIAMYLDYVDQIFWLYSQVYAAAMRVVLSQVKRWPCTFVLPLGAWSGQSCWTFLCSAIISSCG